MVLLQVGRNGSVDTGALLRGQAVIALVESLMSEVVGNVERPVMQVLGREVRPQISAMAPDRAIVHQAMLEKYLLARSDILAGEDDRARRIDDAGRNGRRVLIGLDGDQDQYGKAKQHGCARRYFPPMGQ